MAASGPMRGQLAGHDAAPVVADPDRGSSAEVVMEFRHVGHDVFDRVGVVGRGRGGAAGTAQVGRDAVPTLHGEGVHLGAPHQADARPAVEEDHQRSVGGPVREVVRRMASRAEGARDQRGSKRVCHG